MLKRISTQPLEKFSFGSTFKNTKKISATQLIESCNLKGFKIGGAQVSLKHANFVINADGNASSKRNIILLLSSLKYLLKLELS